ncbi:MAG: hypothetical protein ACI4XW_03685, partial [Candidatus Spyradocola sp.]
MKRLNEGKTTRGDRKVSAIFRSGTLLSGLTLALGFAVVFGVFMIVATPKRHDLKAGDIADVTITATKDIEDTIATQKLRDAAAASIVEGTTRLDSAVSLAVDEQVLGILTAMMNARMDYAAASVLPTPTPSPTPTATPEATPAPEGEEPTESESEPTPEPDDSPLDLTPGQEAAAQVAQEQSAVVDALRSELANLDLTSDQLATVMTAGEDAFDNMCDVVLTLSREAMDEGIREGQLSQRLQALHLQVLGRGVSGGLVQVCYAVLDNTIQENVFIDEEATQEERDKAAAAVEPVMYKKGQNIVQAGEVVTVQQLAMLSSLGLLEDTQVDTSMYLGMAALVALMYGLMLLYLFQFERDLLRTPKEVALLTTVLLLEVAIGMVV